MSNRTKGARAADIPPFDSVLMSIISRTRTDCSSYGGISPGNSSTPTRSWAIERFIRLESLSPRTPAPPCSIAFDGATEHKRPRSVSGMLFAMTGDFSNGCEITRIRLQTHRVARLSRSWASVTSRNRKVGRMGHPKRRLTKIHPQRSYPCATRSLKDTDATFCRYADTQRSKRCRHSSTKIRRVGPSRHPLRPTIILPSSAPTRSAGETSQPGWRLSMCSKKPARSRRPRIIRPTSLFSHWTHEKFELSSAMGTS